MDEISLEHGSLTRYAVLRGKFDKAHCYGAGCSCFFVLLVQSVPLVTEPGISLNILTPMKILQRNLNRSTFFSFTFLTQRGKSASNFVAIVVKYNSGKIIKEMPGSVASGTLCT